MKILVASACFALLTWSILSFLCPSKSVEPAELQMSKSAYTVNLTVANAGDVGATAPPTQVTTFYATGDAPYTRLQAIELRQQMLDVPEDAEFLIHIGDVRRAGPSVNCLNSQYAASADLFRLSRAPVFVLVGDNDWTDCPNREEGYQLWQEEFVGFESKYWEHSFDIQRQPGRPYNFAFLHKGTLFIGLNIVAGIVHDADEWLTRLGEQAEWTIELIRSYQRSNTTSNDSVGRLVIFGHANPSSTHRPFFKPLRAFIKDELHSGMPILYINGDSHKWMYQPNFYDEPSLLRITVSGLVVDPLLKVTVTADGRYIDPVSAFAIDRRLSLDNDRQ
jgi:hypothetical protein